MITKDITITSKNQITLPTSFVDKLQIGKGRVLKATIQGDKIILMPNNDLSVTMQEYWVKRKQGVHLTDSQLKAATRASAAKQLNK